MTATKLPELPWIAEARRWIGTTEITGHRDNPDIVQFWADVGMPQVQDDETFWCGAFVGATYVNSGRRHLLPARPGWARDYLTTGVKLDRPAYGCVAVYPRGSGGHVNFIVGKLKDGRLAGLGANQRNQVNISPFDKASVIGYRWPSIYPAPERFNLPLVHATSKTVTAKEME